MNKLLAALIASVFAVGAFAADAPAKTTEPATAAAASALVKHKKDAKKVEAPQAKKDDAQETKKAEKAEQKHSKKAAAVSAPAPAASK